MNGPTAAELRGLADRIEAGDVTAGNVRSLLLRWHSRICTCDEECCPKHQTHTSPHIGCVLR